MSSIYRTRPWIDASIEGIIVEFKPRPEKCTKTKIGFANSNLKDACASLHFESFSQSRKMQTCSSRFASLILLQCLESPARTF
jgi:hypothetical protein